MRLSPVLCGGVKHVLAVCAAGVKPGQALEDSRSLVLRVGSAQEVMCADALQQRIQDHEETLIVLQPAQCSLPVGLPITTPLLSRVAMWHGAWGLLHLWGLLHGSMMASCRLELIEIHNDSYVTLTRHA